MMNRNGSTRMLQLYLIAFAALFVEVSTGFSFIGRTSPSSTYRRFKPTLLRALRVTIHIRGKGRGGEKWLETAYEQYEERLKPSGLDLVTVNLKENAWHKTDDQLLAAVQKEACPMICLDATGQMLDSVQLSDTVFKKLEAGGSRLCFVIGGAEGLPPELHPSRRGGSGGSKSSIEYLSLSRLTFTHQMARVLLAEQIYRASEIRRGSGYHKE